MASGRGISDAVRNTVPQWVDKQLEHKLWQAYRTGNAATAANLPLGEMSFTARVHEPELWQRYVRRKRAGGGYEREYHCKAFSQRTVTLKVHSNEDDDQIQGYMFMVGGKPVAGGKSKVYSVFAAADKQAKNKARVGVKAKTVEEKEEYIRFTEAELLKIQTQMEYGEGTLDNLFTERVL